MASYVDNFSKLDWALEFNRTGQFPLDKSSLFGSYADAVKYAAGNTADPDSRGLCGASYIGQIITVVEEVEGVTKVTPYVIQSDRTLLEIGAGSGSGSGNTEASDTGVNTSLTTDTIDEDKLADDTLYIVEIAADGSESTDDSPVEGFDDMEDA